MEFWLCFVPLFVAVDPVGGLVVFMGLVTGIARARLRRIILQSVATATAVALAFLAVGERVLNILQVTKEDFMVAGGALLFVLSLSDLLASEKKQRHVDVDSLGAVPLGVPLIVGPAVLATLILLVHEHGPYWTTAALVVNICIAGAIFWVHEPVSRVLGKAGLKAISKLANLLLAAIGVMMIRRGVEALIAAGLAAK